MTRRKLTLIAALLLLQLAPLPVAPRFSPLPTADARQHVESMPRDTDGDPDTFDDQRPTSLGYGGRGAGSEIRKASSQPWLIQFLTWLRAHFSTTGQAK